MKIIIGNDLIIKQDSTPCIARELNGIKVKIYGDFDGLFIERNLLDPEDSIDKIIKASSDEQELVKMLINSVGSFNISVQKEDGIIVYSSPRGPGFFYSSRESEILVCDKEKEFFNNLKDKSLEGFEILHSLLNHPAFRSPFTTVFKNTYRAIGGQFLSIRKNGNINRGFYLPWEDYCSDKRSLTDLSDEFGEILEAMTASALKIHGRGKNYVQISGGIDSCAVLIAAKQSGMKFDALHSRKDDHLTETVKYLCKRLDVPLKLNDPYYDDSFDAWWKMYRANGHEFYKTGLGMIPIKNIYLSPEYLDEKPLSIGGHAIGVLYQGHPSIFPAFNDSLIKRKIKDLLPFYPGKKYFFKRATYTDFWRKYFVKDHFKYLQALALTNKFPVMPDNILPEELSAFEERYKQYRIEAVLSPVLEKNDYRNLLKGKSIDLKRLGQYTRLLRFSTNVQGISLNTENYCLAGGFKQIDPPIQGPMIDFLHKLPITGREALYPKGLEFNYFRNKLNYDYYNGFIHDTRKLNFDRRNRAFKNNDIVGSKQFKEDYIGKINLKKSVLLEMIENTAIREYVYKRMAAIIEGKESDMIFINQVINMEWLLTGIMSS